MPLICHVSEAIIICYRTSMIFFGLQMLLLSIKTRMIFVTSLNASHVNNVSPFFYLFFKGHVLKYFSVLRK